MGPRHRPVLLEEALEGLRVRPGGVYLDGTVGEAGHAREILARWEGTRLVGIDKDPDALELASRALEPFGARVRLSWGSFSDLGRVLDEADLAEVDGILFDLGVSSGQLEEPARGFSFLREGPLDMRMNPASQPSAAQAVNGWEEEELARVIREYGEERCARRVAAAIVREREREPILTTTRLAGIVSGAVGFRGKGHQGGIHPATRTFQALRIAVNQELGDLALALPAGLARLSPGGRMAVISFHSLEDRMVKQFFRAQQSPCTCPRDWPRCVCGRTSSGRVVTRRAVTAGKAEMAANPRARSARLRVFEKEAG
jgi:16S rRNA (cytosine1402-N4)-methyltransferase